MKKKVLLIDDEHDIREVLDMMISVEFEVEIEHAVDGLDGINKLKAGAFDLIICDMHMPNMKGLDVYLHNKETNHVPFILLSGDGEHDVEYFDGFHECQKSNYLNKPWDHGDLINLIKPFLVLTEAS